LKVLYEAKADFDADLSKYGIKKGVFINEKEREVYAPVAMWLEAVDIVLQRLKHHGAPFERIKGISGAGQQHGSVYWSKKGEDLLGSLKPEETLVGQLKEAFAHPYSPNWQDASTQKECDSFDAALGSPEKLAEVTGSKAHHVCISFNFNQHLLNVTALHRTTNHAFPQTTPRGISNNITHHTRLLIPIIYFPRPHRSL